ncbi:hypothetical protein ACOSQ2_030764 [Xanthoceras sorbifolium]
MDSTGNGSFLRNRRFDNFFNTSFDPNEEVEFRPRTENEYVDDDGWFSALKSCVRIMITTSIWAPIMVLLLPWPHERIRQGNVYGHVTGRLLMWILGNPIKIEGTEFSNKIAIYISNHASPIDIFLTMWSTPTSTVGIAKKEIIWYPLFGQLYVLAKHIRIDRSNPPSAIQSMKEAAQAIVKYNLSLIIFQPMIIIESHHVY